MTNVKGRWALVTGASRGIGYEVAVFMAKEGCNLVLNARKLENLDKVVKEVKSYGVKVEAVEAELSDMKAVDKMLDEIEEMDIPIDILFNNAGLQIAYRLDYFETPVEDFTESFLINTIAPAIIFYRLIPKMIERNFGRVINTTSGIKEEPEQAAYSASKAALDKITIDLGTKLEGIDVMMNLADPGWCRTDLGGPNAPNSVESVIPGMCLGAFLDDKKSGRIFSAQDYTGMTLEEAIDKASKI